MDVNDFLVWEQATRDTIFAKKIYIDIAGDLVSGILLSQIVYWFLPDSEGKTKLRVKKDDELWLAKGREDWWDEIRISPKQFDRSIKILEDLGVVVTKLYKFNSAPMKHIRVNFDKLIEFVQVEYEKMKASIAEKTEGKIHFDQRVKSEISSDINISSDFDQTGKSILPKSENPFSPKVEIHFPQTVKSLTETTNKDYPTEDTSRESNSTSPHTPVDNSSKELKELLTLYKNIYKPTIEIWEIDYLKEVCDKLGYQVVADEVVKASNMNREKLFEYLITDLKSLIKNS